MLAESLPNRRRVLTVSLQPVQNALLPPELRRNKIRTRGFGTALEPRYIFGAERLDQ